MDLRLGSFRDGRAGSKPEQGHSTAALLDHSGTRVSNRMFGKVAEHIICGYFLEQFKLVPQGPQKIYIYILGV